jgi:hypothetical protein
VPLKPQAPKISLVAVPDRDDLQFCWHNRAHSAAKDARKRAYGARHQGELAMLVLLVNILIIVVIGAVCFYLIDRFVRDGRLANLLKILVVLICLLAILQRLLPALGLGGLL